MNKITIDGRPVREETPGHEPEPVGEARWKLPVSTLLVALLAYAGVIIMLYPSTAAWLSQFQQSRLIVNIEHALSADGPEAMQTELARAREYNSQLTGAALLESGANVPTADGPVSNGYEYESMLRANDEGVMGRLRLRTIDLDLPIYHGTSDETLERGVGHLEGTALPIGGESLHSVLTAHRGLPSAELFTRLDEVEEGDRFTIEVFGEVLVYQVVETRVVEPQETEILNAQFGRDLVTLVTCTPLGINSHRILVTGERITPTPTEDLARAGATPEVPGFPWWAIGLGAATVLLTGGLWRAGFSEKRAPQIGRGG